MNLPTEQPAALNDKLGGDGASRRTATRPSSNVTPGSPAATTPGKCGAIALFNRLKCDRPKGHAGAHVAITPTGTYGWGGTK